MAKGALEFAVAASFIAPIVASMHTMEEANHGMRTAFLALRSLFYKPRERRPEPSMDHEQGPPTSPAADSNPVKPPSPTPIRTADPPYDKKTADLILRTSDNVDFHVWKCILAEASPVFEDMFVLAQPNQQSEPPDAAEPQSHFHPSVPVVEIQDNSSTLRPLLQFICPPPYYLSVRPKVGLEELKSGLAAAHKYQMDGVVLSISNFLNKYAYALEPLRVYTLGARYDLRPVMTTAARILLSLSTPAADSGHVKELKGVGGTAYHRLCEYRSQCVTALKDMTKDLTWLSDGGWAFKRTLNGCTCPQDPTRTKYRFKDAKPEYIFSAWFASHLKRMASALQDRPCAEAVSIGEELYEGTFKEGNKCTRCREVVHNHMRLFAQHTKPEIEKRIAAISLKFD
ncbi:hypothetical protein LXA43DRAFT_1095634 [Ganoderma leucocontextum]|nr:hypothetical protein LXA43DRAFT_1095634 [Ganoderma leucocontextum]